VTFRVLLLTENLPLAQDHRLRKQVASLLGAGFEVTVVCRRHPGNHAIPGAVVRDYPSPAEVASKFGYLREYGWSLACAGWQVLRCLRAEGFDAIQVASTPDIYFLLTRPLRRMGKRVVFDARDLSPEIYTRRFGANGGAIPMVLRWIERLSYRAADRVLAVNYSVAEVATARGGVHPSRVEIVGNGPVMADVMAPARAPHPGQGPLCCWVGVMGPQDGVELALQAIALLEKAGRGHGARFVFAGAGDALPSLRRLTTALGLDGVVSFPGWLEPAQVRALLDQADIGLEPNLEDFVTPVKAMEYMAHGLAVVAFDLRETRNIIGPEARLAVPGDVADFADCLEALLSDPVGRWRLGHQGHLRAESLLAWERQEPRYIGLYQQLLSGPTEAAAILEGAST
jgi:glycosyltransferase involved in cell wall biosynthesis